MPQGIAGLDVTAALARVRGDKSLYGSLLRNSMKELHGFAARFEQAVAGADSQTAERLAHTLKGVLGVIGAMDLAARAEALETAIVTCRDAHFALVPAQITAPLAALLPALADLLAALERHFSTNDQPQPPQATDRAELQEVCRRLAALLREDDPEAESVYHAHAELLNAAFAERAKGIEAGVAGFDFESALAALQQAMQQAGLTGEGDE